MKPQSANLASLQTDDTASLSNTIRYHTFVETCPGSAELGLI